ncbi:hypothetical protein G4B88_005813 [Cannabis sativa]|uniref:Mannosyltransferase n=1 Tax=Cannabis sativa TaxID=3483 RepID=A0A7J6G2W3_CANSA|nr:hypothetical protein G4B88_005813 [Cannabis sativa]
MALSSSKFLKSYGYDLLLGSIAAFYVFTVPYTKVEESFNVQYDHLEFPGVVPRTFLGALLVSTVASPVTLIINLMHFPKLYALFAVRMALGCIVLSTLHLFRLQVRDKFGQQVEVFFVILTALQFHLLFYCSRPLPNIFALGVVFCWLLVGDNFKVFAPVMSNVTVSSTKAIFIFLLQLSLDAISIIITCFLYFSCIYNNICDIITLDILIFTKSITIWGTLKHCVWFALVCIGWCTISNFHAGLTILIDSILWRRLLWPEFEVFWFNSVLNRSSEWGVSFSMKFLHYTSIPLEENITSVAAQPDALQPATIPNHVLPSTTKQSTAPPTNASSSAKTAPAALQQQPTAVLIAPSPHTSVLYLP